VGWEPEEYLYSLMVLASSEQILRPTPSLLIGGRVVLERILDYTSLTA